MYIYAEKSVCLKRITICEHFVVLCISIYQCNFLIISCFTYHTCREAKKNKFKITCIKEREREKREEGKTGYKCI